MSWVVKLGFVNGHKVVTAFHFVLNNLGDNGISIGIHIFFW